jgi:hypothetical protein
MAAVVEATCPGCKKTLRIPAEWLGQAFKCKHCGLVIQAKEPPPTPVATAKPAAMPLNAPRSVAAPRPVAARTPVPPTKNNRLPIPQATGAVNGKMDGFEFDQAPGKVLVPPRRRGSGLLRGLLVFCLVIVVAGAGGYFGYPYLSAMMPKPQSVARGEGDGDREKPRESDLLPPPPKQPEKPLGDTGKKPDTGKTPDTGKKPNDSKPDTGKKPPDKPMTDLPTAAGPFPRRALIVNVNNYFYANPIGGSLIAPNGTSLTARLSGASGSAGLRVPTDQILEVSETATGSARTAPTDSVIKANIANFLDTARAQDRLFLVLIAHVVELEDEAFLVPIHGDPDSKETLIPLKWLFEKMTACKARQKVLVLDTARLDPAVGQKRSGSNPMGEKLDALLKAPPGGVQVWSACVAGQASYESNGRGVFVEALCEALDKSPTNKIPKPDEPLPIEALVESVNVKLKAKVPAGKEQTSRLTGSEAPGGADYDPKEARPAKLTLVAPPPLPGGNAKIEVVRSILKDINLPSIMVGNDGGALSAESMPPFLASALQAYQEDKAETPLRKEIENARAMLTELAGKYKLTGEFRITNDKQLKDAVEAEQKKIAVRVYTDLDDKLTLLQTLGEQHRKDESKRWQVTYDYVVARLEAQLAYLVEYEALLGQIRKDTAMYDKATTKVLRLASEPDPTGGDTKAKKLAKSARAKLAQIASENPNTPWAVLARRDKATALGLRWEGSEK